MKQLLAIIILATVIAFQPSCSAAGERPGDKGKAPNFALKTSDGRTVELDKLKGKVVVVNFWATWCGPCRMEIPGFTEVYGRYRTRGLEIVGISLDQQGWDAVKPYVAKERIPYPVVLGDEKVVADYGNFNAIPTTFIVDKAGKVVDQHTGYMSKEDFEQRIKPLL